MKARDQPEKSWRAVGNSFGRWFAIGLGIVVTLILINLASGVVNPRLAMIVHVRSQAECRDWIEELRSSGIRVQVEVSEDPIVVKKSLGVRPQLWGCATSEVLLEPQYVLEGPVPPSLIWELRAKRPDIRGIAAVSGKQGPADVQELAIFAVLLDGEVVPVVGDQVLP